MPWSRGLARIITSALLLTGCTLAADDGQLWHEYGLVNSQVEHQGKLAYTAYQFKDLTGALAAWEWQRAADSKSCDSAPYCSTDGKHTWVFIDNYLLVFDTAAPPAKAVDGVISALPNRTDTALPAILTFIPRTGLVPNSARYVLGPASLHAFAPEFRDSKPGFATGAEAQVAKYKLPNEANPVELALFYYPTPEMARLHTIDFKQVGGVHVKRSGVLVAIVYGGATDKQADTLLSRVQYEAKITWNDSPPPSPIKPLYQLLWNIIYVSILLCCLGLAAGLVYAGIRIYRRRYGQLEADEAMTTLHLSERS